MPLTSNQKHYIKKNIKKLPVEKIAADLSLSERDIHRYLKKQWGQKEYSKFLKKEIYDENSKEFTSFNFKKFFIDNLNFLVFLFILILACYSNSIENQFVSDDIAVIKNNPEMGKFSLVFSNFFSIIQMFLYYVAFHLGGGAPWMFRIINISLHFSSAVLLFSILNLSVNKRVAFLGTAIFAAHPILVESITWISGMPYALYSFFLLLAFLFYIISNLKQQEYTRYSLFFFFFALMSSEKAIVFPGILFIFELSRNALGKNWKKTIPFFFIDLFFIIFYLLRIGKRVSDINAVGYQDSSGFYNPLIQIPTALANYFKLIFWPKALSLYQTEMTFSNVYYAFFFIISLLFFGLIFYSWKKNKHLFFWLSFFIISLLPVLTPFKISWIVAERYVYLGSIGIFVCVAIFFDWALEKSEKMGENYKIAVYSLIILIISALSIRTVLRNIDWKNEDNLWIATAKVSPSGPNIHNNLGDVYGRQGNLEKSAEEFEKAIKINPNYADAYHNLGNVYRDMKKYDLALENYQKALSINPNIWQSYQNIAAIYFDQNDLQKAYEMIKKALEINPSDQKLQQNLKVIEGQLNKK